MTEKLIDWQLNCFARMGFGGVNIYPRTGLDTKYLGDEYMHLVKYAVERCRKNGCWKSERKTVFLQTICFTRCVRMGTTNGCMYGEDSILLQLKANAGEEDLSMPEGDKNASPKTVYGEKIYGERTCLKKNGEGILTKLAGPDSFSRAEPNVLLLDYARYQLNDGPIQPKEEILRADNWIRSQLGFVLRRERMNQPWFMPEKETHKVTLYYEVMSETETEVSLAMEDVEHSKVTLNGEPVTMSPTGYYVDPDIQTNALPRLQKGKNDLKLEIAYNQKSGLENMFLLGNFDVELSGNKAVIKAERKELELGDITRQGMPFYTGNLEYTFHFAVKEEFTFYFEPEDFMDVFDFNTQAASNVLGTAVSPRYLPKCSVRSRGRSEPMRGKNRLNKIRGVLAYEIII